MGSFSIVSKMRTILGLFIMSICIHFSTTFMYVDKVPPDWRCLPDTPCTMPPTQVHAKYFGSKVYEQECTHSPECKETDYCDPYYKKCMCLIRFPMFLQVFDERNRRCVNLVGKLCTFESQDQSLPSVLCVPNVMCHHPKNGPEDLGFCMCKEGFHLSKYFFCASAEEIQLEADNKVDLASSQGLIVKPYLRNQWDLQNQKHLPTNKKIIIVSG